MLRLVYFVLSFLLADSLSKHKIVREIMTLLTYRNHDFQDQAKKRNDSYLYLWLFIWWYFKMRSKKFGGHWQQNLEFHKRTLKNVRSKEFDFFLSNKKMNFHAKFGNENEHGAYSAPHTSYLKITLNTFIDLIVSSVSESSFLFLCSTFVCFKQSLFAWTNL